MGEGGLLTGHNLSYQCFICKSSISNDLVLDPCAVTIWSNCDQEEGKQRGSQILFCHYNCLQEITKDPTILQLEYLSTNEEVEEEARNTSEAIDRLSNLLFEKGEPLESGISFLWAALKVNGCH